jgi:two-component system OmpR family response regulator
MSTTPTLQRILYVEDDPDIQLVARMALVRIGRFTVQVCSSGAEALAAAAEFNPDLLLLDVMMPEMDGMTTLAELRRLPGTRETPAVFMTARVNDGDVASYLELGAIGVIAKPFDAMQLAAKLRELWQTSGRSDG